MMGMRNVAKEVCLPKPSMEKPHIVIQCLVGVTARREARETKQTKLHSTDRHQKARENSMDKQNPRLRLYQGRLDEASLRVGFLGDQSNNGTFRPNEKGYKTGRPKHTTGEGRYELQNSMAFSRLHKKKNVLEESA
jgi:hypothetical protein